jgi:hypothetical protein
MVAKIENYPSEGPKNAEEYLDPALWEQFVEARRDLCDFTTSTIKLLTFNGSKPIDDEQTESEQRLLNSINEMLEMEKKLTSYLSENLSVLKGTIDELTKNQVIFSQYSKHLAKPDPGYISSQA